MGGSYMSESLCWSPNTFLRGNPTLGKIARKFEKWEIFGKNTKFSPILRKKWENSGKNTKFSRNYPMIFPSVVNGRSLLQRRFENCGCYFEQS